MVVIHSDNNVHHSNFLYYNYEYNDVQKRIAEKSKTVLQEQTENFSITYQTFCSHQKKRTLKKSIAKKNVMVSYAEE